MYLNLFVDPMKRATIEDIRKHEWFMKVQNLFILYDSKKACK